MKKYVINTRYEYWSKSGKKWTDWFISYNNHFSSLKEAENKLKEYKSNTTVLKKLKLKHEYKIEEI